MTKQLVTFRNFANAPKNGIYSVILPTCTVGVAVKAMCKCCARVSGCDSKFHFQSSFHCSDMLVLFNLSVAPALKFYHYILC